MNDQLIRDCRTLSGLCRELQRTVQRGDTQQLARLHREAATLMVGFQSHWAAMEPALRTGASGEELTRLKGNLNHALMQINGQQQAVSRALDELGSGPRLAVTPSGFAVGGMPAPAEETSGPGRSCSNESDSKPFSAISIP